MFLRNQNQGTNDGRLRDALHSNQITFHNNATTDNWWPDSTAPLPVNYQQQPWHRRALWVMGNICAAIVRKINQVLGFLLWILTLLLIVRFLLTFFSLSRSLFSQWIFIASTPFMLPFTSFLPITRFNAYSIDGSVLVAIGVYWLGVFLVRRFLRLLVTRPSY
ncbi:YggT family protein [Ktedonospora formicarum]|uniref:YggT family protein n=1 Tax=Ktedonospora formicarum TaxID=2778364 RepID=A0A8J3I1R4_9CHLR|nr:YggT family protein [Ktedonospora formicarum]GHO43909.1 hypothetical protein KSX_20720 [Ktedonospora formicarum]